MIYKDQKRAGFKELNKIFFKTDKPLKSIFIWFILLQMVGSDVRQVTKMLIAQTEVEKANSYESFFSFRLSFLA